MQLHERKPKTVRKTSKRVGRGRASGKGKTSGRGTKGQKARAGHRIRPDIRETLKKLPKLRGRGVAGLRSILRKGAVINVAALETAFTSGDTITPALLLERGLLRSRNKKALRVKILGEGEVTKRFVITGCAVSSSARTKIEKAGGSVTV